MKRVICTVLAGLLAAPMAFGQADPDTKIHDIGTLASGQAVLTDGREYSLRISVNRTENKDQAFGSDFSDDNCLKPGVCAIANEFVFGGGSFESTNTELARSEYAIGANVQTARVDFWSDLIGEQVAARWTRSGPVGSNEFRNKVTAADGLGFVEHSYQSGESATSAIQVNSSGPLLTSMGGGFISKNTINITRVVLP